MLPGSECDQLHSLHQFALGAPSEERVPWQTAVSWGTEGLRHNFKNHTLDSRFQNVVASIQTLCQPLLLGHDMHKSSLRNNSFWKHTTGDGLNTRQQTKWTWKLLHVPFKIGKEYTCPLIWSNLVRNVPWKINPVRKEVVCRCSMFRQTLIIGERQWICDRVCKRIFWSGPSSRMPPPRLMKCHYEVLEAPRYV